MTDKINKLTVYYKTDFKTDFFCMHRRSVLALSVLKSKNTDILIYTHVNNMVYV